MLVHPGTGTVPGTQWVGNAHVRNGQTSGHKPVLQLVAGEPQLLLRKPREWRRQSVVELLLRDKPETGWELVTTQEPLEHKNADHSSSEGH